MPCDNCANNFSSYSTWQVMEEYLPRELQKQYRRIFNNYDVDETGVIHIEDVAEVVSRYGKVCSAGNIRQILKKINKQCYPRNINHVDFHEFVTLMTSAVKNCVPEDEMLQIFHKFDQDGDGYIGREELRNFFCKIGEKITEKELDDMIRIADEDGDGLVSYNEFVRTMTNSADNQQQKNLPSHQHEKYLNKNKKIPEKSHLDSPGYGSVRPPKNPSSLHEKYKTLPRSYHSNSDFLPYPYRRSQTYDLSNNYRSSVRSTKKYQTFSRSTQANLATYLGKTKRFLFKLVRE